MRQRLHRTRISFQWMLVSMWGNVAHLDEGDFTLTDIAAGVLNGDFPIVLDPALTTQNVVNTRCHFVPLIVVSQAVKENRSLNLHLNVG